MIDLSKYCNKVTVDQDARIARVQGGALWEDVDNATCALGLVTVGGIVSHVSTSQMYTYLISSMLKAFRLVLEGVSNSIMRGVV